MLTKPILEGNSRKRQIFYKIKYMSDHIIMTKKGRYYNMKPSSIKGNIIYLVIGIQEVIHLPNLVFFTKKGEIFPCASLDEDRHGYVLLAMIKVKKKIGKRAIS